MDLRKQFVIGSTCVAMYVVLKILSKRFAKRPLKRCRKTWQEKWLMRRNEGRGVLNLLQQGLLHEDPEAYKNFLRMDNLTFVELISLIEPDIRKQDTQLRECISADKRLAVTLRYLATGNTFRDLMFATRIHESTISLIVIEVCNSIIARLLNKYLKVPNSEKEWLEVANHFEQLWNYPYCLGALDGKHINFQSPRSCGSFYYNYKGTHSIVLLALVDANYKFLYVDVGVNGSQ